MAKIDILCECNNRIAAEVGQNFRMGTLNWYISYKCDICGATVEQDGINNTPEEIRNALIIEEGLWGLIVNESGKEASTVLKVLRKILNLSLIESSKMLKLMPGLILSGTITEMERLKTYLSGEGINVSVTRISSRI